MKKLDVGNGTTPKPAKKSNHATVEVGDRLGELLRQFVVVNPQYKQFAAQHKTLSADIGKESRTLYFSRFAGVAPESSTMIADVDGKPVQLIVKDAYSKTLDNEKLLVGAIGQENADRYFRWKTDGKLNFDAVPEDKAEAFAKALSDLTKSLGIPSEAMVFKQYLAPNEGFHAIRTVVLTPEQNRKLDAVMPTTAFPMIR